MVLTAKPEEYRAVSAHLTDIVEDEHPEGDVYECGRFDVENRQWQVGIVEIGMGNPNAAQKTERAIAHLKPDAVLFVGVAGGIKDVKIGDVVVATKVYDYHSGKAADQFQCRPEVVLPHHRIMERARAEARKNDWLKRLAPPIPAPGPRVFLGAIAAGEQVVVSTESESYKLIREKYNDALALEMESYGFLKAAHAYSVLEALVVRGISDLLAGKTEADEGGSQERASRHAAAFAFQVLARLTLPDKSLRLETSERKILTMPGNDSGSPAGVRSNLPHQPYFFGRQKELETIADAISPQARTWGALIDGPGGIGKTALAIRAGHLAPKADFPCKIFLSAKERELTATGEKPLQDFMLPTYQALLVELANQLGQPEVARLDPNERTRDVCIALAGKRALIIIDNIETLPQEERDRLYQFLSRLPTTCKAIVTSRRRTDLDARTIRLDRLEKDDALALLAELAKDNPYLQKTGQPGRLQLYEITQGNPLLMRWLAGQLGRPGSQCRTIDEAATFIRNAPANNDPLAFIFGDLVDTFTAAETSVLAALTHFTLPAKVEWLADLADLPRPAGQTALEDLSDRALVVADPAAQTFLLPALTVEFLRRTCPQAITQTGDRLADRGYALALENGYDKYNRFPVLEAEWPTVVATLPRLVQGENDRLQSVCDALFKFLDFTGYWDDWLSLSLQAEEKALAADDFNNAGWRAHDAGWVYYLRGQATEVLACADRCAGHWHRARSGTREKAVAIQLRGMGHQLKKDYPAANDAYREALQLNQAISPEGIDVAIGLNALAGAERLQKYYKAAGSHYREALRIANKNNYREGEATYTGNLAELALVQKKWPEAEKLARQALDLSEKLGRQELIGANCRSLAQALAEQGRASEGLPFAGRAVDICTRLRQPADLAEAQAALTACSG